MKRTAFCILMMIGMTLLGTTSFAALVEGTWYDGDILPYGEAVLLGTMHNNQDDDPVTCCVDSIDTGNGPGYQWHGEGPRTYLDQEITQIGTFEIEILQTEMWDGQGHFLFDDPTIPYYVYGWDMWTISTFRAHTEDFGATWIYDGLVEPGRMYGSGYVVDQPGWIFSYDSYFVDDYRDGNDYYFDITDCEVSLQYVPIPNALLLFASGLILFMNRRQFR